jgi:hypothetical protein
VATPDGISREDWDKIHELAVEIVNSDELESAVHKSRLLSFLDQLEAKYGELPSILATRADYIEGLENKEKLLKRAYMLASTFQDTQNQLHVAHSLAELYMEDLQDTTQGKVWLECLGNHLKQRMDPGYLEDYLHLRSSIQGKTRFISPARAEEVIGLLEKLNGGNKYWDSLYWEFQEDFTQLFVRVLLTDSQNTPENVKAATCILRSVLSPLLPSNEYVTSWCAVIVYEGEHVGGAIGGIKDDWKTLGMES